MFDFFVTCKFCGKKDLHGWHPIWKQRQICIPCQEKMYARHKVWMDKLNEKAHKDFITNASWCVYDYHIGAYAQSCLFLIYTGLAVWGIVEWTKKNN